MQAGRRLSSFCCQLDGMLGWCGGFLSGSFQEGVLLSSQVARSKCVASGRSTLQAVGSMCGLRSSARFRSAVVQLFCYMTSRVSSKMWREGLVFSLFVLGFFKHLMPICLAEQPPGSRASKQLQSRSHARNSNSGCAVGRLGFFQKSEHGFVVQTLAFLQLKSKKPSFASCPTC